MLWNPLFAASGLSEGVPQFTVTGTTNIPVMFEACTNLITPDWLSLQITNILTAGSLNFTDPDYTNYPARFYRITGP